MDNRNTIDQSRCSDNDPSTRDVPSFIEPKPPLFSNPFMRPRPNKGTNLLELFEEDLEWQEPELVQVYLRLKPCIMALNNMYEVRSDKCLITCLDTATMGHGRRTQHNVSKMYTFSHIFRPECCQKEIFEKVVKDNLRKLPEGHNFTLLTYGASGSGKTFTLMGTVAAPGLVPRSLEYVFRIVDAAQHPVCKPCDGGTKKLGLAEQNHELLWVKKLRQVSAPLCDKYRRMSVQLNQDITGSTVDLTNRTKYYLWVSFVEIYNEGVYDLLVPGDRRAASKLRIREDTNGKFYVQGAKQAFVRSGQEAYNVLVAGKHNLQVAATGIHSESSRSHCIFTITMLTETEYGIRSSHVRLCDLAGCERARRTRNTGARMQESRAINTSLHVLERCLQMLRRRQGNHSANANLVPYRESKLTRLLGAGLCGSRGEAVSMVVTINPVPDMAHESRHVLQLAAVARDIHVNNTIAEFESLESSVVTQDATDMSASDVADSYEVMRLKAENERLHYELTQAESLIKELRITMDQKREETYIKMKEIVEETKDVMRHFYEPQIEALQAQIEDIMEEKNICESKFVKSINVDNVTPMKLLQDKNTQLMMEIEILKDNINVERQDREKLEEQYEDLHRSFIEETEGREDTGDNISENRNNTVVVSDSEHESDEEEDNESLEPIFLKETLNRSKLKYGIHNEVLKRERNYKERIDLEQSDTSSDALSDDDNTKKFFKAPALLSHTKVSSNSVNDYHDKRTVKTTFSSEILDKSNVPLSLRNSRGKVNNEEDEINQSGSGYNDSGDRSSKDFTDSGHGISEEIKSEYVSTKDNESEIIMSEFTPANSFITSPNFTKILPDETIVKQDSGGFIGNNVVSEGTEKLNNTTDDPLAERLIDNNKVIFKDYKKVLDGQDASVENKYIVSETANTKKLDASDRSTYFVTKNLCDDTMDLLEKETFLENKKVGKVSPPNSKNSNNCFRGTYFVINDATDVTTSNENDTSRGNEISSFERENLCNNSTNTEEIIMKGCKIVEVSTSTKKSSIRSTYCVKKDSYDKTIDNENVTFEENEKFISESITAQKDVNLDRKQTNFETEFKKPHTVMNDSVGVKPNIINSKSILNNITQSTSDPNCSLTQFEQLEKAAKDSEKQQHRETDIFSNTRRLIGNRTYFNLNITGLNDDRKKSFNIETNNSITQITNDINKLNDDLRSASIIKNDIPSNNVPNKINNFLGESYTKNTVEISSNNTILVSKHESLDVFEEIDSPYNPTVKKDSLMVANHSISNKTKNIDYKGLEEKRNNQAVEQVQSEIIISDVKEIPPKNLNNFNATNDKGNDTDTNFENIFKEVSRLRETEFESLVSSITTAAHVEIDAKTETKSNKIERDLIKKDKCPIDFEVKELATEVINPLNATNVIRNNTTDDFEDIFKNVSRLRETEFESLVLGNSTAAHTEIDANTETTYTEKEKPKYNLRHKSRTKCNEKVKHIQTEDVVLEECKSKCESKAKSTKKSLRLRRPKKNSEEEILEDNKLKDIVNLQSEFSDVTLDVPAPKKDFRDMPSPVKDSEEENTAPMFGIQSCPSKSVTRSRRKLYTPRAEPLEEFSSNTEESNERIRVPRPSYHRSTRVRRKL